MICQLFRNINFYFLFFFFLRNAKLSGSTSDSVEIPDWREAPPPAFTGQTRGDSGPRGQRHTPDKQGALLLPWSSPAQPQKPAEGKKQRPATPFGEGGQLAEGAAGAAATRGWPGGDEGAKPP